MLGMKAAAVTGGIGIVAVLAVFVALMIEKSAHATTKQALADEKSLVADLRSQQATAAADRAVAVSDALARQQADIDRQLENEQRLRVQLAKAEDLRRSDQRAADASIARLKNENENLREWTATAVPDDIVDWVHDPADEAPTPATP